MRYQSRSNPNSSGESIGKAILAPLALLDAQQHALGIDVRHLQRHDFGDPQSSAIGGAQRRLVLRPGGRLQRRAISSRLKTTGILRGSRTKVRCLAISGRSSVTVKKKRSAATEPLMLGARTPACV